MFRISAIGPVLALMMAASGAAQAQPQGKPPAQAAPGAPALSIRNDTPNTINNIYVSLTSQQNWGQDQLGATEVVRAGGTRAFTLPPGECLYDIRIVYQGNVSEERRRIDACAEQSLVLPLAAQRAAR
jgi:hypothetical protein